VKLSTKRRKSSKLNYYIISLRVIIQAIIIIDNSANIQNTGFFAIFVASCYESQPNGLFGLTRIRSKSVNRCRIGSEAIRWYLNSWILGSLPCPPREAITLPRKCRFRGLLAEKKHCHWEGANGNTLWNTLSFHISLGLSGLYINVSTGTLPSFDFAWLYYCLFLLEVPCASKNDSRPHQSWPLVRLPLALSTYSPDLCSLSNGIVEERAIAACL